MVTHQATRPLKGVLQNKTKQDFNYTYTCKDRDIYTYTLKLLTNL